MLEDVPDDILRHILVRLDVVDLIRCQSVCKSWQSFISHPLFVKTHLNHSYNNDRKKNGLYDRRIYMGTMYYGVGLSRSKDSPYCYIVGSSNGLICICTSDAKIIVANPCTRQVKELPHDLGSLCWSICCGFGYDSSSDDYKVVVGFRAGVEYDRTFFQVFSLKSNEWKAVGEVKYRIRSKVGILCNGSLHWVMYPSNHNNNKMNPVILSFNLCREDWKEIPQPDDAFSEYICLGNMDECLCLFHRVDGEKLECENQIWTMKNYNVKESWEIVGSSHHMELHFFLMDDKITFEKSLHYFGKGKILRNQRPFYTAAPIFVRSLVCPHVHSSEQCARSSMRSGARVDAAEDAKLTNYSAMFMFLGSLFFFLGKGIFLKLVR